MRNKNILFFLSILLLLWVGSVSAAKPMWTIHTPSAHKGADYQFVVEHASGAKETEAVNKAIGLVYKWAIQMYGGRMNAEDIDELIYDGTISDPSSFEFEIPVRKVAQYTKMLKDGGCRVYVLYQVAVPGVITPRWDESDLKNYASGVDGKEVVDVIPDEWDVFESDTYFSVVLQDVLEKGIAVAKAKDALESKAKNQLISDVHLDENLIPLIHTKYNNYDDACCALAYIEREAVEKQYLDEINEALRNTKIYIDKARRESSENQLNSAKSSLEIADSELDKVESKIKFLNAFSSSSEVSGFFSKYNDYKGKITENLSKLSGDYTENRQNRIKEFTERGLDFFRQLKLDNAFRYLYGAYLMLEDLKDKDTFRYKVSTGMGDSITTNPNVFLYDVINDIIGGVRVKFDGFSPDDKTRARLSFSFYRVAKGMEISGPIVSLKFKYFDGQNWSDSWYEVKDGIAEIDLLSEYKPTEFSIKIDYRSESSIGFDDVVKNNMRKYADKLSFNQPKLVAHVDYNAKYKGSQSDIQATVSMSNIEKSYTNVVKTISNVSEEEKRICQSKILEVCKALTTKKGSNVRALFTTNGYDQFSKLLMNFGTAKVLATGNLEYFRLGDEIQCRSIPMEFNFSAGNKGRENVAFTFTKDKLIDGIQFTLESTAQNDILGDNRISEESRLAVLNFMENYKTAFSLKDLEYIESIFSDDAVIIVGRKLQNQGVSPEQQALNLNSGYRFNKYTKKQYIDNVAVSFKTKEWIRLEFGSTQVSMSRDKNQFSINLFQEYLSSNYGDRGYLFLFIDTTGGYPKILVRTWESETGDKAPYDIDQYYRDME